MRGPAATSGPAATGLRRLFAASTPATTSRRRFAASSTPATRSRPFSAAGTPATRPRRRLAALVAAALLAASGGCNTGGPPKNGDLAPEFVLESASGAVRKLSNYRGKVVLVNLWATWCPPCIAEFPMLESLAKDYADKGLVILAVAGDEDTRAVHDFLRRSPAQFEVLLDPDGAIGTRYGITGYPETFFVDRQGRLRDKIIGPLPHEGGSVAPSLIARIEEMLKGT